MSPQEISDRFEVQDLLARYCYAIDDRDWGAFARLFTADAILDFTAFGGPRADVPGLVAFMTQMLAASAGCQHTISTSLLAFDGDSVRARTAGLVPIGFAGADGVTQVSFSGLWYHDLIVRTAAGWRFKERVQVRSWTHNMPQGL
jgi:hypothetical protein